MKLILSIALGGALGAVGRHFVSTSVAHWVGAAFPWGTLTVNTLGSLCLGALVGVMAHIWSPPPELRGFLVVGMLGAFTTFSTFSLDFNLLVERGNWDLAGLYAVASVVLAAGALFVGLRIAAALVA